MAYLSADKKNLQNFMQVILGLIFFIAHYFIFVLIVRIFEDAGREELYWLQWKFHYT